jgi:hypothetical protein
LLDAWPNSGPEPTVDQARHDAAQACSGHAQDCTATAQIRLLSARFKTAEAQAQKRKWKSADGGKLGSLKRQFHRYSDSSCKGVVLSGSKVGCQVGPKHG